MEVLYHDLDVIDIVDDMALKQDAMSKIQKPRCSFKKLDSLSLCALLRYLNDVKIESENCWK